MSRKIGLVLEGGGMRGIFTAGVTDVMLENDICYDILVGVSAGACFGCNYKSKQPGRVIRYNLAYCRDPRYCSFRSLIKTGNLFGADFCYHEIPEQLDLFDEETFVKNPMQFHFVCTDVETGKPVYHVCKATHKSNEMEWLRASASLPLVSKIVEVEGMKLMDGGISDSVPLRYTEDLGYTHNVVVLTQPEEYVKGKNAMMPFLRAVFRKYPAFYEAMERRYQVYNETIKYVQSQKAQGYAFVIQPPAPLPVGRVERDPRKLQMVYEMGRKVALNRLEELKDFVGA